MRLGTPGRIIHKYILSAICPFTKFAVTEAIPDKTAATVAKVIVNKNHLGRIASGFDVFDAGVQTFRPTLLFSGFRHLVPWSGRGDVGGGAVACDWLVGGG